MEINVKTFVDEGPFSPLFFPFLPIVQLPNTYISKVCWRTRSQRDWISLQTPRPTSKNCVCSYITSLGRISYLGIGWVLMMGWVNKILVFGVLKSPYSIMAWMRVEEEEFFFIFSLHLWLFFKLEPTKLWKIIIIYSLKFGEKWK